MEVITTILSVIWWIIVVLGSIAVLGVVYGLIRGMWDLVKRIKMMKK